MKEVNKFKPAKLLLIALSIVAVLGLVSSASAATEQTTHIRIAHFVPDAPAVNIFVNGKLSGIQTLKFNDISGWVELPAGSYSIAVVPDGQPIEKAIIGPAQFNLGAGQWLTVSAIGSVANNSLKAAVTNENFRPLPTGSARVTVFHAIEDAPAVDVILPDGKKLVSSLAFGRGATLEVPAGAYDLKVVPAGARNPVVIDLAGTALAAQNYYFVAAVNKLASPNVALSVVSLGQLTPLFNVKNVTSKTIAQIAVEDGRFTTLVTALKEANLVDTLNGAGRFTVFAPTDAAFAKLPAGTLDAVLKDKNLLSKILLYHVVGGEARASDVISLNSISAIQGGPINIEVKKDGVFLNGNIKITITDILATNGVIHVIDGVLLPQG
jgi:uncharacterized surface protein with fasciclin (FAS1) repeats